MAEKSIFLQIFLINLQEKSHVIWEFLVVYFSPKDFYKAIIVYTIFFIKLYKR